MVLHAHQFNMSQMASPQRLSKQDWVTRCALEMGALIPSLLRNYAEELPPSFVLSWAEALWADTAGAENPEEAAWMAVNEVCAVRSVRSMY